MTKQNQTTMEEFNGWLGQPEGLNLEFKTAKHSFSADKDLPDYCAALSNEGGGKLILGVAPDHRVVGTKAFQGTHNKLSVNLLSKLKIRIDVEKFQRKMGPKSKKARLSRIFRRKNVAKCGVADRPRTQLCKFNPIWKEGKN